MKWFRKSTNQHDAAAYCELGERCRRGIGVQQDYREAARWYRKAADLGDPVAQYNLGVMYRSGQGVPQNNSEAAWWYQKAAEQGDSDAQKNLGDLYRRGEGVRQDAQEAVSWYQKAATQGHSRAQLNLGVMYRNGLGVERDYHKAAVWFRKAADQGEEAAERNLGTLGGLGVDWDWLGVDGLNVVISREEVASIDTSSTMKTLSRLLADRETVQRCRGRIQIAFYGFDDDPREVYEIPDVRRFCVELDKLFPYWFYFLSTDNETLKMIAFCLVPVTKIAPGLVKPSRLGLASFLASHFLAMNTLFENYRLEEEINIEISDRVNEYFLGPE